MLTGILARYEDAKLNSLLAGEFGEEAAAAAVALVGEANHVNGWAADFTGSHFGNSAVKKLQRSIDIQREALAGSTISAVYAAAPEMLNALQGVLEFLDEGTPVYPGSLLQIQIEEAVSKATLGARRVTRI